MTRVDAVRQQALQWNCLLYIVQAWHSKLTKRYERMYWLFADAS
jgi:hypothetical protein